MYILWFLLVLEKGERGDSKDRVIVFFIIPFIYIVLASFLNHFINNSPIFLSKILQIPNQIGKILANRQYLLPPTCFSRLAYYC